jgi:His/Glu/Gln/Arg/opine family amino acid ABC transporter permease subunit
MFDFAPILPSWRFLAAGLLVTLELSALTIALGLAVGLIVGVLRTYGWRWLAAVLSLYVDTARAIPQLVILVWTYFAFPLVIGHSLSPMQAATLALGLHLGAYVSEVIRAGLTSVRPGQMRAGLTLGMSRLQAIRTIILPQAAIRMMPPLGSLMVIAVKDTSIAAVIAVPELMRQSQIVSQWTFRPLEIYTGAMIVYFLVCYPLARGVDRLYRRLAPLGAS